MRKLTDEGRRIIDDVAARYGASVNAVTALAEAIAAGGGTQAQFTIQELGGMGQWSRGGMTMVGDMFNNGLKARVDGICSELSGLLGRAQVFEMAPNWWPGDLGRASATGAQDDMRYAVFPDARRLAVEQGGRVTVYDTGAHQIGGASQQQGGNQTLSFGSQFGTVRISEFAIVSGGAASASSAARNPEAEVAPIAPVAQLRAAPASHAAQPQKTPASDDDIFGKIERLAGLHQKGILTDREFEAKKGELLARF